MLKSRSPPKSPERRRFDAACGQIALAIGQAGGKRALPQPMMSEAALTGDGGAELFTRRRFFDVVRRSQTRSK